MTISKVYLLFANLICALAGPAVGKVGMKHSVVPLAKLGYFEKLTHPLEARR